MAITRKEKIERKFGTVDMGGSWEAPVLELETDDGMIEVLGWDGMNEDPDNSEMPWQVLAALTPEGETKYIAVPLASIEYLGMKTEAIGGDDMSDEERAELYNNMTDEQLGEVGEKIEAEQRKAWLNFINFGDDWEANAMEFIPKNIAKKKTDFNLRDMIMKIWQDPNAEVVKVGEHSLHLADKKIGDRYFFGNGPDWAIGSVLYPYRKFMEGVVDTIKKGTDCYVDGRTGRVYPADAFRDGDEVPEYRISVTNISITEADIENDWAKAWDDERKIPATLTHGVTGTVNIMRRDENGNWSTARTFNRVKLADIPAMNMSNGRFKKGGSIYSIVNKAFSWNTKLRTAGMALQEGLEVGIYDFVNQLGSRISDTDLSRADATFFDKINMNSGFTEIFLNAHNTEGDADSELEELFGEQFNDEEEATNESGDEEIKNDEVEDELTSEEGQKKENDVKKEKQGEAYIRTLNSVREWQDSISKKRSHLKGSAMYDNENNPFPRAQMTIRFDEKMNDPNLLTTYMTDSSGAPEGKNAPRVGRMLSIIRVGLDGTVYKPVLTLEQLKNVDAIMPEDVKWIRAFKKKGETDHEALEDCYFIRASQVNEDGTLKTVQYRGENIITAQLGESLVTIDPYNADRPVYISPDPRCDHVAGTEQSGLPQYSKEVRTQIKTSNLKDAAPRIETQSPSLFVDNEPAVGEELITKARMSGTVEKIEYGMTPEGKEEPVSMTVLYDDETRQTIDLRFKDKQNSKYAKRQQPCVGLEVGRRFAKGQALTDAPGVSMGMATAGPPLVIVICSGPGENGTDDSVFVSKRAADVLGYPIEEKQTEEIIVNEGGSPYGPTFIFNPTIGKESKLADGKYDCSKLGDDGIVKDGEIVKAGDIIAYKAVPNGTKKRTVGEQLAMKRPEAGKPFTPPSDYKIIPIRARKGVVDARVTTKRITTGKGRSNLEFNYFKHLPVTTGSKISFDGIKSVVYVAEEGDGFFIHAPGSSNFEEREKEQKKVLKYIEEFNKFGDFCEDEIGKRIQSASGLTKEQIEKALAARGGGADKDIDGVNMRREFCTIIRKEKDIELAHIEENMSRPSILDGVEADIVTTEQSLMNRSTLSFLIAGLLMRYALELGVKIDRGIDSEHVFTDTMNMLRKAGLGDGSVKIHGKNGVNVIPMSNMQGGIALVINGMNVGKMVEIVRGDSAVTNSPMVEDSVKADALFAVRGTMVSESPSRNGSITKTSEQAAMYKLGFGTAISPEDSSDHYNPGYTEEFFGRD